MTGTELADEPAGNTALLWSESWRGVAGRVNGKLVCRRGNDLAIEGYPLAIEWVPQRNGYTEEPLPRNEPVAGEPIDPVVVAHPHEIWVEADFLPTGKQAVAEVFVLGSVADVPLASCDDLEGLIAFFEKLHGVNNRFWLTLEVTRFAEHVHDGRFSAEHCLPRERLIGLVALGGGNPGGRF